MKVKLVEPSGMYLLITLPTKLYVYIYMNVGIKIVSFLIVDN